METSATQPPLPQAAQHLEAGRLAEAFRIFNQASEELAGAYTGLQEQVARLTGELALANGRLKREYEEKAALTERLALLLDTLPAGVVVLDGAGRVAQSNPAAGTILGAALEGLAWDAFSAAHLAPTSTPGELEIAGRRVAIDETRLIAGGGRLVLIHDVSEAHRLKTQAARSERLAAMGEMAAALAHQLRTPLAAALLYAGALENPQLPAAEKARVGGKVVERLQHLEQLIRDMLTFARGETTGGETIAAAALLAELAQVFEPLAARRGIALRIADRSGGLAGAGSRKALAGALTNLLENALDACREGGEVELCAAADGGSLHFHVRDDGRGIDATTQARLFEPFFTTRAEGTGLGLAIAQGVARAHGGGIEVQSQPGAGADFRMSLPACTAAPSPIRDAASCVALPPGARRRAGGRRRAAL